MSETTLSAGSTVYVGAPVRPMAPERLRQISDLVGRLESVREAHLPQCYIAGQIDPPAQVLVVVLADGAYVAGTLEEIGAGLRSILPEQEHLDVLPLQSTNQLLPSIRSAGCRVGGINRPWWKPW